MLYWLGASNSISRVFGIHSLWPSDIFLLSSALDHKQNCAPQAYNEIGGNVSLHLLRREGNGHMRYQSTQVTKTLIPVINSTRGPLSTDNIT